MIKNAESNPLGKYLLTVNKKDVKLKLCKSRNELTIDFKHVFGHKQEVFISFNQFYQCQCLTFQASG